MKTKKISGMLAVIIVLLTSNVLAIDYYCSSCAECSTFIQNRTLNSDDILYLTTDLTLDYGNCIEFNGADNIIFDCQNHVIDGVSNQYFDHTGIDLPVGSNNNYIQNCQIKRFMTGVSSYKTNWNTFDNLTIADNYEGFYLGFSLYNIIQNSLIEENLNIDFLFGANNIAYCNNDLTNVIGSNGGFIDLYHQSNLTIENLIFSQLILCDADNSLVNNVVIHGSEQYKNNGLYVLNTDNAIFENITLYEGHEIYMEQSSNNVVKNVIANSNQYYGITLHDCNNFLLENIETNYNTWGGIRLSDSLDINITGLTSKHNSGLFNDGIGVFLDKSSSITIVGSDISNQSVGILISRSGIEGENLIYNNYFSNINNTLFDYESYNASYVKWNNSPECTSPNMINESCTGGNYWSNQNGNGFSDTCSDNDNNGFCDLSYNFSTGISTAIDYLSLSAYSQEQYNVCGGEQIVSLCICGDNVYSFGYCCSSAWQSSSCTPPVVPSPSGSGGGGGGGGGITSNTIIPIEPKTNGVDNLIVNPKDINKTGGIVKNNGTNFLNDSKSKSIFQELGNINNIFSIILISSFFGFSLFIGKKIIKHKKKKSALNNSWKSPSRNLIEN